MEQKNKRVFFVLKPLMSVGFEINPLSRSLLFSQLICILHYTAIALAMICDIIFEPSLRFMRVLYVRTMIGNSSGEKNLYKVFCLQCWF